MIHICKSNPDATPRSSPFFLLPLLPPHSLLTVPLSSSGSCCIKCAKNVCVSPTSGTAPSISPPPPSPSVSPHLLLLPFPRVFFVSSLYFCLILDALTKHSWNFHENNSNSQHSGDSEEVRDFLQIIIKLLQYRTRVSVAYRYS